MARVGVSQFVAAQLFDADVVAGAYRAHSNRKAPEIVTPKCHWVPMFGGRGQYVPTPSGAYQSRPSAPPKRIWVAGGELTRYSKMNHGSATAPMRYYYAKDIPERIEHVQANTL